MHLTIQTLVLKVVCQLKYKKNEFESDFGRCKLWDTPKKPSLLLEVLQSSFIHLELTY